MSGNCDTVPETDDLGRKYSFRVSSDPVVSVPVAGSVCGERNCLSTGVLKAEGNRKQPGSHWCPS